MKKIINLSMIFLIYFPSIIYGHEAWLMTPEQFMEWSTKPVPSLFTSLNLINGTFGILMVIGIYGYYLLSKFISVKYYQKLQKYLPNNYDLSLLFLRLGMAITLIIAGFGMIPREGFEGTYIPTLFVSDLQLPLHLVWIKWAELIVAACLILGIYNRLMGLLILIGLSIAFYQFGSIVVYYSGYIAAIAIALLIMGSGRFSVLPNINIEKKGELALFILRMGTGLNFVYGGIYYKFLHPNIDIGMLIIHNSFTFGLGVEIFTLLMAVIETTLGILLILGVLIRPLSVIIFLFFIGMGILVNENVFAHAFIIGILCALFLNGSGKLTTSKRDKPGYV